MRRDRNTPKELERQSESELLETLAPLMSRNLAFEQSSNCCMKKGLIPGHLLTCFEVLVFLCETVVSAQKAQRKYGVRASVLLSMALDESAFDVHNLATGARVFWDRGVGGYAVSSEIDKWFLYRAKTLTGKRFKDALNSSSNPKAYLDKLSELGYCDSFKASDLLANIESFELERCDLAGMLPIGQYSTEIYSPVRDEQGNLTGLKPSEYVEFLQRQFIEKMKGILAA